MQWFKRAQRAEIWDETLEPPAGDIEAAKRIREICRAVADSAEKVGAATDRSHKKVKRDVERYERAARAASEGAKLDHGTDAVSRHPGQIDPRRSAAGFSSVAAIAVTICCQAPGSPHAH